ncbi:MAG: hypothetical protein ACJAT2_002688 [Bacteriovoracaceae bacterium]|jgi:hypothetical protein
MKSFFKVTFFFFLQLQIISAHATCEKGVEQLAKVIRNEMDGISSTSVAAEAKSAALINDGMQGAGVNAAAEAKAVMVTDSAVDAKAGLVSDTEAIAIAGGEARVTNMADGSEQISVLSLDSRGIAHSDTNSLPAVSIDSIAVPRMDRLGDMELLSSSVRTGPISPAKATEFKASLHSSYARSRVRTLPSVERFKTANARSNLEFDNRLFISGIDDIPPGKKPVYFDVENSVLKQLNDEIMETKDLSDATGNLFNRILYDKIQKSPELSGKLEGRYRDFKSLRFRFLIDEGEDSGAILKALKKLYQESTTEFEKALSSTGLKPLWEKRTGQLGDPKKWFLAGTGDTPLEANMAARQARGMIREPGSQSKLVEYQSRVDNLASDIKGVESIRLELQNAKGLSEYKIIVSAVGKKKVLSKDAIGILRKTKSTDFESPEKYHAALNTQFKKIFGTEVDPQTLDKMTTYFESVDSLAPPLFVRNRAGIDLGQSENGLVSVDFTGVGVDNAYQAMVGLAKNTAEGSNQAMVGKALTAVDEHVEKVTDSMNTAKRAFNRGTQKVTHTRKPAVFSGDDGIYFPDGSWSLKNKEKLVRNLGRKDPSKYRVTFVETKYPDGTSIPVSSRSEYIVRAEKVEKEIRKAITGVGKDKISPADAKKLMIAIDYKPSQTTNGEWGVLLGGKVTKEQKRLIDLALEKVLSGL